MIGRFLPLARDDQRGTRFVDQDIIHLVNDGKVQFSLYHLLKRGNHVIAQVVKAELVVCAIGYIGVVGGPALSRLWLNGVDKHTNSKPQGFIDLAHPLGVTPCQVVVDGDDVYALACQGIQISR